MINQIGHGLLVLAVLISLASAKPTQAESLDQSLLSVETRWADAAYSDSLWQGRLHGRYGVGRSQRGAWG